MISIVDYGLGNVQAFANIYKRLDLPCMIVKNAEELLQASRIILPGVGSFDWAIELLENSGMRKTLDEMVINRAVPVLGVCVGMQIMAERSDEGKLPGLGWIKEAEVKRFDFSQELDNGHIRNRLPHMGWNDVKPTSFDTLFKNLTNPQFYFLHSYYFLPNIPQLVLAQSDYGIQFVSAIAQNNIMGVQFHPEKSHHWGVELLRNFSEI